MSENREKPHQADLFSQSTPFDEVIPEQLQGKNKPELTIDMVAKSKADAIIESKADVTEIDGKKISFATIDSVMMDKAKPENTILLFRRGTFLRAYDGSAWLVSTLFRSEYKILRDKLRNGTKYVYLGFPANKLNEVFSEDCTISEQEGLITVSISPERTKNIPSYDKWLKESKVTDKKETELPDESNVPISSYMHISNANEIAFQLATYHMENHTMIDNIQFLANLIASIEYKN